MSREDESCHMRMDEACHIWTSHVIYECVMSQVDESCHVR